MKKYLLGTILLVCGLLLLVGCAAGPNALVDTPMADGNIAGFWHGFWHGLIAPITFFISLFSENVHIYEVHNNGGWYNFGFVLGAGILFGGGGSGSSWYIHHEEGDTVKNVAPTAIVMIISLITANILYEFMADTPQWSRAAERSFFEAIAIILFTAILSLNLPRLKKKR